MTLCKRIIFLIPTLLLLTKGFGVNGNGVQPFQEGPVHEAFITREFGQIILESVPMPPPQEINEQIPPQPDSQLQWIPGYWAFSKERSDFIWVSGVWRRPPPGHQWIGGYWKEFDEGWVWLNGFWSRVPESRLEYIDESPPNEIDESLPPSPGSDYFWMKGYWFWDASQKKYVWYGGRFEKFDPNWVYAPAHYIWREGGYVFIPGYWDWPLDARGTAYAAAIIEPALRPIIVYEPALIIDPFACIRVYYLWWPDYLCLYHYYFHFHEDFWISWGVAPPWWWWDGWWGFAWHDCWWLFWWWGHPGFPHPFWLDAELAAMMAPPPGLVLSMLSQVLPPPIVLADGVVGPDQLLDAINEVTGGEEGPIMPVDKAEIDQIHETAVLEKKPERPYLKPTGPAAGETERAPDKPHFGPEMGDLQVPPRMLKPPVKPTVPLPRRPRVRPLPPIRPVQPTPPTYRPPTQPPSYRPPTTTVPPTYTPPSQPPTYRPPTTIVPPTYKPPQPPISRPSYTPPPTYTPPSRPPSYRPPMTTVPPTYTPPSQPPSYRPPTTTVPPTYTPPTTTPPPSRMPPESQMRPLSPQSEFQFTPRYQPKTQTRSSQSTYQTPYQGSRPEVEWPPNPRAMQHLDIFMQSPQPQVNPRGPKVHEPGKYWGM